MNADLILQQFRERAAGMEDHTSYQEMVNELATLLAESRGRLPKEHFETLIKVGAALYKAGLSQYSARGDVAEIMRKSGLPAEPDDKPPRKD